MPLPTKVDSGAGLNLGADHKTRIADHGRTVRGTSNGHASEF